MKVYILSVLLLPLLLTYSHPISMICVPVCSSSVTANEALINHWLTNDQSTGIDQLLNHRGTVIRRLLSLSSTDGNKCFFEYNSIARVPRHTNVSVSAIRQFFNAYLVHKLFVEHLMKLNPGKLVSNDWVHHSKVYELTIHLKKLHHILKYNLKSLAILLRINNTCDGCKRNCSRSADVQDILVQTMNKCSSPIHSLILTIGIHSHKLSQTLHKFKETITNNGDMDGTPHDISIDELCWCGH